MSIEQQPKVPAAAEAGRRAGAAERPQGRADAAAEPLAPGRGSARPGHVERRPDGRLDGHDEGRRPSASAVRRPAATRSRSSRSRARRSSRRATAAAARRSPPPPRTTRSTSRSAPPRRSRSTSRSRPATRCRRSPTRSTARASTPVYASLLNGKLVLSGKQTGADNAIARDRRRGRDRASASPRRRRAANADFWVGATHYTDRTSNVVTDVMAGVELTLRGTTGAGTVSVVVGSPAADTDAVKTKVQAFVDQYNSTIDFVRGKLNEDRVVNPTTDADRAKGVLRGDPGLDEPAHEPARERSPTSSPGRPADTDQLSEAGVSTGATHRHRRAQPGLDRRQAHARRDEAHRAARGELRRRQVALHERRPARTTPRGSRSASTASSRRGSPATARTRRSCRRGSTRRSSLISDLTDQMAAIDQRLSLREAALRQQFTALETALRRSSRRASGSPASSRSSERESRAVPPQSPLPTADYFTRDAAMPAPGRRTPRPPC